MPEQIVFPEWRQQHDATDYPFAASATLTNDDGIILLPGTWIDAALYPIGGTAGMYFASADVGHETVTVTIGDRRSRDIASGTFRLVDPPDTVALTDAHGRPAGILVSESARLGIFQSWGVGLHEFRQEQTEFAATVCFATPEPGVRGFLLDDGTLITGDVWLVAGDGVAFSVSQEAITDTQGNTRDTEIIRVDIVGDPLFRRRLCFPEDLFSTPRFLKKLRVISGTRTFEVAPDTTGAIRVGLNNALATSTVLRLVNTDDGLKLSAVGSTI